MEEQLAKLSIADKKLIKPANQFISKNQGIAGAYLLDIKAKTKVYRYDVEIIKCHPSDSTKSKTMTKRAPDE
jgi:hypothetical protein